MVANCQNGILQIQPDGDNDGGYITITQSGIGIVSPEDEDGENNGAIITVPREESLSQDDLKSRDFVALVFLEDQGVMAVNLSFDANGEGTYRILTSAFSGEESGETGTIEIDEIGAGDKAGFVKLVVDPEQGLDSPHMWGAVSSNLNGSGKAFMFATGFTPNHPDKSFSVIALEK